MRLVSGQSLHAMLEVMAQRGRPGIWTMRQVLATRGLDSVPPASNLEARFEQILLQAGDAPMRRPVDIGYGEIRRASGRESVGQDGENSVGSLCSKKKTNTQQHR